MCGYLTVSVLLLCTCIVWAEIKVPQVDIYTRHPIEEGKENVVICCVRKFHPPIIDISLKEDGKVISGIKELDLSFDRDWTFWKVIYAEILVGNGPYTCDVKHYGQEKPTSYQLEI